MTSDQKLAEAVRIVREEARTLRGAGWAIAAAALETVLAALEESQRESALNRLVAEKHYALAEERGAALEERDAKVEAFSLVKHLREQLLITGKQRDEARAGLAAHLAAHKTADAHDCAEMEEEYQRVKAERDEARAEVAAMKKHHDEMHELANQKLEQARIDRDEAISQAVSIGRESKKLEAEVERLRGWNDKQAQTIGEFQLALETHSSEMLRVEREWANRLSSLGEIIKQVAAQSCEQFTDGVRDCENTGSEPCLPCTVRAALATAQPEEKP